MCNSKSDEAKDPSFCKKMTAENRKDFYHQDANVTNDFEHNYYEEINQSLDDPKCFNHIVVNCKTNDYPKLPTRNTVKTKEHPKITKTEESDAKTKDSSSAKEVGKVTSRIAVPLFLLLRMEWLVVLCAMLSCVNGREQQKFAIEPQDQSAVVGSRVTLPCRVENKAGQLQWTKDDFGLGTHRHLAGYDRYKMIGSDEEGDYSLDIREVTLDDDAQYQCQVSSGPRGEPAIRSRYALLHVLVPPEPPRILQGLSIQTIEDQDVSLECASIGGKPAAEITWVDNEGGVLTQGVTYTIEPMADGRRFTARSVLSIRPRRHHDNQTFTCQAQNTADRAYKTASIKLEVKYAPKVRLQIKTNGAKNKIQEGDTLRVGCQASANPNDLTFKWFMNNDQIIGNFTNELVIRNVSRKFNEGLVKCEVYNSVGKSADSKNLEVTYGPSFLVRPQDVEAEQGWPATLHCSVDGHPQPDIIWLHYERDRIVRAGKSPNLTLTVTPLTAGQYCCRAAAPGYRDIEASATVYVKGPPKIQSNRTQYGVEGDSVKVECMSFSVPKPDYVIWSIGGVEISPYHNQDYAFLEETLNDGITKSSLIIRESEAKHFGLYNCTVTNLYGTDTIQIHLIPDKSFPLIVIVSGGASSAILVLIIMLMIMLCHRRRRKSIPGDFDKRPDITDIGKEKLKDSDGQSNVSDLKMELRHVEGSCEMDTSNASETEFHSNAYLGLNPELPLAGPVPLSSGYDNELMKHCKRYSSDFGDPSGLKVPGQSTGYIPYVDYSRDYVPPQVHSTGSLNGSLSRSIDTTSTVPYSGHSHNGSMQRLGQGCGPDVIPMNPVGLTGAGGDVRYAATNVNRYLRVGGAMAYMPYMNSLHPPGASPPAPPPYYSVKSPNLPMPPVTSSSSLSSSRSLSSPNGSSSTSNGAQPQVPKASPQSPGALYVLQPTGQGSGQTAPITTKGNTALTTGTHV